MGVDDPQLPARIPTRGTQDTPPCNQRAYAYGALTLYGAAFQRTSASPAGIRRGPATPHPPSLTGGCSVWAVPLSVAPTHGIAFAFFSCGYSDVSFPRVPAPIRERPRRGRIAHSGIPGSTAPCASPGFSQLGTPFVGARAEPSTGRDNRRKSLTGPSKYLGTPLHGLITHEGLNPSPATFPSPGARIKQSSMDSSGFEPEASASQRRRSTRLSYEPMGLPAGGLRRESPSVGGDPAADSPTATLLRLSPPRGPWARPAPKERASPLAHSGGLTGGVCKEQGRIHRAILRRDYYGFQVHEGELQPSIPGEAGFRGLPTPFGVGTHCPGHCSPRVARGIRGIRTCRCPHLPPA